MQPSVFNVVGQRTYKPSAPPLGRIIPRVIPVTHLIAENDHAAIGVESIQCWPEGFTINATVFLKSDSTVGNDLSLISPMYRSLESVDPDGPCLGIVFSNGVKVTTIDTPQQVPHDRPSLSPANGLGGGTFMTQGLYIHPLPPPGPVTIAARWNNQGVPEGNIELSGEDIIAAGNSALLVW